VDRNRLEHRLLTLKFDRNRKYIVSLFDGNRHLTEECNLADNFIKRLKGLMFRQNMSDTEGLLIVPCNSIHTFFMKFPIDLVFIDHEGNAVADIREFKPGRVLSTVKGAWAALELNGGRLENIGLKSSIVGSKLVFKAA
jgi:uncharacterized membrane protein (UPF0127 family)